MNINLVDTFEKYSLGDPSILKEEYYIPAPDEKDYLYDDDFDPANTSSFYDSSIDIDDDLDEDVIEEEHELQQEESAPQYDNPSIDEGQLLLMVKNLHKTYKQGSNTLTILNNVDLRVYSGEICALVGPSGSGKTGHFCIYLDYLTPSTSGQIFMGDRDSIETL